MALVRRIRKSIRGLVSRRGAIMCAAVLSILLARSAPPGLPHISLRLAVNSHADHDHRQCFDHEDSQCGTSPSATLTIPPPVVSPHPARTFEPFVEIVTDGWHYNRPPPIS